MSKITIAYFQPSLRKNDAIAFRGALLKMIGNDVDASFHHHDTEGLIYSYPSVQYKLIDGCPAVLSIDVPLDPVIRLFDEEGRTLRIGRKKVLFTLDKLSEFDYAVEVSDAPKFYKLSNYLPLNEKNVVEYDGLMALTDKICFLENILTANILSFFKGIGYHADEKIEVAITNMQPSTLAYYKKVGFRCFDLEFVTNVCLPSYIGLGKSTSVGFGLLQRQR